MKIISLPALILTLLPLVGQAAPGNIGVGVEGTLNSPSPSLRIALDERTAINFSVPELQYRSESSYKTWEGGLGFAVLPLRTTLGNLKHGPRFGLSGSYENVNPDVGVAQNYLQFGLNFGWDLEYFVAAIPGLSIGGNVGLGYSFNWTSRDNYPDSYGHDLATTANTVNVRYYF